MSDPTAIAALMQSAADDLATTLANATTRQHDSMERPLREQIIGSMSFAEGVLRAVAASVEQPPTSDPIAEIIEALLNGYGNWAGEHDEASTLTQVEISSVARFLGELVISD